MPYYEYWTECYDFVHANVIWFTNYAMAMHKYVPIF